MNYSMNENAIIFSAFLIFAGASLLSTAMLYTRQTLLVAYILGGLLLGPWGLKLLPSIGLVNRIGSVGIIFLLFLLGLNLNLQDLLQMFKKTFWVTLLSSIVFFLIGFFITYTFGFSLLDCMVIGITSMFSSTIISLKLLPNIVLHHQRTGELVIGVLLVQDLLALLVLLFISLNHAGEMHWLHVMVTALALPCLFTAGILFTRIVLMKLFTKFDHIHEYVFLVSIAWCLTFAELAKILGLSYEIGAFIAGVSIATGPTSIYISKNLKPLRDFFLVLFFFSIGANFDLHTFPTIVVPVLVITAVLVLIKPVVIKLLLQMGGETKQVSWEVGLRLGQTSCFSLLIAQLANANGMIDHLAVQVVHTTTVLTFIISSYIVVLLFPTPIGVSRRLREEKAIQKSIMQQQDHD